MGYGVFMALTIAVLMDPIESINPKKDSTLAILREANGRGHHCYFVGPSGLTLRDGKVYASAARLLVGGADEPALRCEAASEHPTSAFDVLLMRKDPPFDMEYVYTTYLLERVVATGTPVFNDPRTLRDFNEKLAISHFAHCAPPTLVTRDPNKVRAFIAEHGGAIVKPLEGMGGFSIFRVVAGDPNTNVIIETMTHFGRRYTMVQRYVPEISEGDKRIIVIDGEPMPGALARIPAAGDSRGNLAAGASIRGVELSERDRWICAQVGPELRRRGVLFCGLDVIGDFLTEINVTSPTGIQEIDRLFSLNIAGALLDALERRLSNPTSA